MDKIFIKKELIENMGQDWSVFETRFPALSNQILNSIKIICSKTINLTIKNSNGFISNGDTSFVQKESMLKTNNQIIVD